jgi:hypothetical protein
MKTELDRLITGGKGEREIHAFLKKYPALLRPVIGAYDGCGYILSEFSIGENYRADLVSIWPTSGWFHIAFIELEAIDATLFTKKSEPRKELNHAFNQIEQWRTLIDRDKMHVVRKLAEAASTKDILYQRKKHPEDIKCTAGLKLDDPNMVFSFDYFIFIGRREPLSQAEIRLKNIYKQSRDVDVATYDRLLDAINHFDIRAWGYDEI